MPSIGGVTCAILNGDSVAPGERVQTWNVPGRDNYGAQKLGKGDSRWLFEAQNFDTVANLETWRGQLLALRGTKVSATDGFNVTHPNLLVENVEFVRRMPAVIPGGAADRCKYVVVLSGVVVQ